MSFTPEERAAIFKFLCVSPRMTWNFAYDYPIDSALTEVGNNPASYLIVKGALTELEAVDGQMRDLMDLSYVKNVDEISLDPALGFRMLKARAADQVRILSNALGLEPLGRFYSPVRVLSGQRFI